MARVCDSCDKRYSPDTSLVDGEIPQYGFSGVGFKVTFEITFSPKYDDADKPDICPRCVILSVKNSIEKWFL